VGEKESVHERQPHPAVVEELVGVAEDHRDTLSRQLHGTGGETTGGVPSTGEGAVTGQLCCGGNTFGWGGIAVCECDRERVRFSVWEMETLAARPCVRVAVAVVLSDQIPEVVDAVAGGGKDGTVYLDLRDGDDRVTAERDLGQARATAFTRPVAGA
jgi:hypothetical protein